MVTSKAFWSDTQGAPGSSTVGVLKSQVLTGDLCLHQDKILKDTHGLIRSAHHQLPRMKMGLLSTWLILVLVGRKIIKSSLLCYTLADTWIEKKISRGVYLILSLINGLP